jgi:hypothetical protein
MELKKKDEHLKQKWFYLLPIMNNGIAPQINQIFVAIQYLIHLNKIQLVIATR